MYTIYIKQSSIRFMALSPDDLLENPSPSPIPEEDLLNTSPLYQTPELISKIKEMVHSPIKQHLEIRSGHPKQWVKQLKQSLQYVKAAGGLVRNEKKQYLFILRLGLWDLPKGKLEMNEKIEDCAQREVEEECGVRISLIKKELPSTYHIYQQNGILILKRTYWFLMKAQENCTLIPQKEEGIEEVCWLYPSDFTKIRENTYPSVLEVMKSIPE